jgi:hypothetical protein
VSGPEGGRPTAREVVELLREHRQLIDDAGGWASRIPAERMGEWERKKRDLLAWIEAHTPGIDDGRDDLEGPSL